MKYDYSQKNQWIKVGLSWGTIMFVTMEIAYPFIKEETITLKSILIGVLLWSIAGLSFGYTMKKVNRKDNSK